MFQSGELVSCRLDERHYVARVEDVNLLSKEVLVVPLFTAGLRPAQPMWLPYKEARRLSKGRREEVEQRLLRQMIRVLGPDAPPAPRVQVTTAAALRAVPKGRRPFRDELYLAKVRLEPCCSCGAPAPSEAHHAGPRGLDEKADDLLTVPLCPSCHAYYHKAGELPGRNPATTVAWVRQVQAILLERLYLPQPRPARLVPIFDARYMSGAEALHLQPVLPTKAPVSAPAAVIYRLRALVEAVDRGDPVDVLGELQRLTGVRR